MFDQHVGIELFDLENAIFQGVALDVAHVEVLGVVFELSVLDYCQLLQTGKD